MAQRDIEILKGDGQQMGTGELPKSLGCRLPRPSVPNALEIGIDLHDLQLYMTTPSNGPGAEPQRRFISPPKSGVPGAGSVLCRERQAASWLDSVDEDYRTHDHTVAVTDVQRYSDKVHGLLVQEFVHVEKLFIHRDTS